MIPQSSKSLKNVEQKEKTQNKKKNKPMEWYWNVLQAVKCAIDNGARTYHLNPISFMSSIVSSQFQFPFPAHEPHIPIEKFFQIYYDETKKCKLFYNTCCLHCQKLEVICIVGNNYLDDFMRYDQLKKCIKKSMEKKKRNG